MAQLECIIFTLLFIFISAVSVVPVATSAKSSLSRSDVFVCSSARQNSCHHGEKKKKVLSVWFHAADKLFSTRERQSNGIRSVELWCTEANLCYGEEKQTKTPKFIIMRGCLKMVSGYIGMTRTFFKNNDSFAEKKWEDWWENICYMLLYILRFQQVCFIYILFFWRVIITYLTYKYHYLYNSFVSLICDTNNYF